MLADSLYRVRSFFRRNTVETELADELDFHVSRLKDKYVQSGMPEEEALRRARQDFGGLDSVKEECRDARGIGLLEEFLADSRHGFRLLRKSPGFTTAALLTLGLAIGANVAIFSIVDGTLLRPLPYPDANRLIVLNETTPTVGSVSVSYLNFLDWRAQARTFSGMAAVHPLDFSMAGAGEPGNVAGLAVSANLLSLMGIHPIIGRDFTQSEDNAGTPPVVLISYRLWQSHFAADSSALGRIIALNGESHTIVGVLPAGFRWTEKVDVLEPAGVWITKEEESVRERGSRDGTLVVARLAPGASLAQARTEMEHISRRLAAAYNSVNDQSGVELNPIGDVLVGDIRTPILVLFAAVVFVLLIACANVANLFLMKGASRTREIALRLAIGASRARVIRQMLAESFVLAALGGALGLAIGATGIRALQSLIPVDHLTINITVFCFLCAVVVLCTFLFGVAPAVHSSRSDVNGDLRDGGRNATSGSRQGRLRNILATAEVALALVLLVGAGLMIQSLYRLLAVDPGFRAERVLTLRISCVARSTRLSRHPGVSGRACSTGCVSCPASRPRRWGV